MTAVTPDRESIAPRRAETGFTLLELLIALMVMGLLSLLLFTGLRFGTRVWEKTEMATADANRVRSVQATLTHEISHIYPIFVATSLTDKHVEFDGEPQRMTFLAPSATLPGAMNWVTIITGRGRQGLALQIGSVLELAPPGATATHTTLIDGLRTFEISYFGPPAPGAPPLWTPSWSDQRALPLLIRIRATFLAQGAWPDLVVAPQIAIDQSCVFDALAKYCQGR